MSRGGDVAEKKRRYRLLSIIVTVANEWLMVCKGEGIHKSHLLKVAANVYVWATTLRIREDFLYQHIGEEPHNRWEEMVKG